MTEPSKYALQEAELFADRGTDGYSRAARIIDRIFREGAECMRERAAARLEAHVANYPSDVFAPPPHGQHAKTVDGCSAHALRFMLPLLADIVRELPAVEDEDEGGAR